MQDQQDSRPVAGDEPTPGAPRLGGRYELGAVLGRGGMATVRRGTDLRLKRTVAVKTLHGELTGAPAFQTRFRREARAAAALHHRAIVSVYDAGEDTIDDELTCFIVMEYVDGHTLRELLRAGPQDPGRALEMTAEVLEALAESHRCGIVHRDIKPANVMLTRSGAVKVMDFGVARAVADMSSSLTQTATVIGTAHYLSPEQARGDTVDARSDVYSTGCLLYELLTGRPPFVGDSAVAVAYQHVREAPQPPSAFEPTLPPEIDSVVLAALAKQPDERYRSAAQMRGDLLAVLAGEQRALGPVLATTAAEDTTTELAAVHDTGELTAAVPPPQQTQPGDGAVAARRHRRRVVAMVAAAAVVLVAGLGGFALSRLGDAPAPRQDVERTPDRGQESPREAPAPVGGSGAGAPAGVSDPVPVTGGDDDPRARAGDDPARPERRVERGVVRDAPAQEADGDGTVPELTREAGQPGTPTAPSTPPETAPEDTTTPSPTSPPETTTPEPSPSPSPTPEPTPTQEPESSTTPPPSDAGSA